MTEFTTGATLDISVPDSELRGAREDIEDALGDIEISVTGSAGGRPGGGAGGRMLSDGGDRLDEVADLTEDQNKLLEDIEDGVNSMSRGGIGAGGGGGGGGGTNFVPTGGGGGGGMGSVLRLFSAVALGGAGATAVTQGGEAAGRFARSDMNPEASNAMRLQQQLMSSTGGPIGLFQSAGAQLGLSFGRDLVSLLSGGGGSPSQTGSGPGLNVGEGPRGTDARGMGDSALRPTHPRSPGGMTITQSERERLRQQRNGGQQETSSPDTGQSGGQTQNVNVEVQVDQPDVQQITEEVRRQLNRDLGREATRGIAGGGLP